MAEKVSFAEALAVLAAQEGFELTETQKQMAEEVKRSQIQKAATEYFGKHVLPDEHLAEDSDREQVIVAWAERSFSLAKVVSETLKGETQAKRGAGQGYIFVRSVKVETPSGTLKIELSVDQ